MNIPNDKQVNMGAYKLKGAASASWDHIQSTKNRHDEHPIKSWSWMK